MRTFLFSVLLLPVYADAARSPAGPVAQELTGKRISCRAVKAQRFKNGVLESSLDPAKAVFKTCNQFGGTEHDDHMCFVVKTLSPSGEPGALGFGCLPLNDETVRRFDGRSLRLRRGEYDETIEMDFTTGFGRISYDYTSNDWGRRTRGTGSADLVECRVLAEPAISCAAARDQE